eukprot:sb/3462636/
MQKENSKRRRRTFDKNDNGYNQDVPCYQNSDTASDEPGPSSRRKAPKRANKPAVLDSNSEDDFSPSPTEKSRKRKLKRRPASLSPILNNKELFDSQRSTTPESTSADSPTPTPTPSNHPIPSIAVNRNDLITSSSEEALPNTHPERVTELERRRKQRDLCEQAVRRSDFASGQVIVNPRVVSSDEEESGSGKDSGASTSTIDTDATLSDDPPSTKGGDSDEESLVVNRRKNPKKLPIFDWVENKRKGKRRAFDRHDNAYNDDVACYQDRDENFSFIVHDDEDESSSGEEGEEEVQGRKRAANPLDSQEEPVEWGEVPEREDTPPPEPRTSKRKRGITAEKVEVPLKDGRIVEFCEKKECPEDHPFYSAITAALFHLSDIFFSQRNKTHKYGSLTARELGQVDLSTVFLVVCHCENITLLEEILNEKKFKNLLRRSTSEKTVIDYAIMNNRADFLKLLLDHLYQDKVEEKSIVRALSRSVHYLVTPGAECLKVIQEWGGKSGCPLILSEILKCSNHRHPGKLKKFYKEIGSTANLDILNLFLDEAEQDFTNPDLPTSELLISCLDDDGSSQLWEEEEGRCVEFLNKLTKIQGLLKMRITYDDEDTGERMELDVIDLACMNGIPAALKILLPHAGEINSRSRTGNSWSKLTTLHRVVVENTPSHRECVKLLAEHRPADLLAVDSILCAFGTPFTR